MAFLILVIGVLNVCLGYALAVHLGYGPGGQAGQPEPWVATPVESPVPEEASAFDFDDIIGEPAEPHEEADAESLLA